MSETTTGTAGATAAGTGATATGTGATGAAAGGASGGQAAPAAFAEQLPEDIRGEAAFRDIKDLGSLAKGYLNAQKMLGHPRENLVVLPAGPDDADGWNAVYARLGRPEKADDYKLPAGPEGLTVDPKLQSAFLASAHAAGLSTKQAAEIFGGYQSAVAARMSEDAAAATAAKDATVAALKQEWGAAFDGKVQLAKAALQHYGDPELTALLDSGAGNDPRWIKTFARMGEQLAEDGVIGRAAGGGQGVLSPGEAQQQINGLMADKDFMAVYRNARSPGHADAVAKMQALYEMKVASAA